MIATVLLLIFLFTIPLGLKKASVRFLLENKKQGFVLSTLSKIFVWFTLMQIAFIWTPVEYYGYIWTCSTAGLVSAILF
jgi:fumarate reductase subunit D